MRRNYEYFNKQQGFVRTDLQVLYTSLPPLSPSLPPFISLPPQMTKSLSKIATASLPMSYSSLRRSLGVIVTYAESDSRVQVGVVISGCGITTLVYSLQSGSFVSEIRDLMIKLRTVLSSTSQMKVRVYVYRVVS